MSASFETMATVTATTTRRKADKSGLETNLEAVKLLPLMPVSAETVERLGLNSPRESKETFTQSHQHTDSSVSVTQVPDVLENDRITIGGTDYIVQRVGEWNRGGEDYLHIVVDEVKTS